MRKIFNIAICALFALLSSACNKVDEPMLDMADNEGVLALNISMPQSSRNTTALPDLPFELKIYRYADAEKSTKELVRKYTALNEIPEYVWLVKDNYMVQVKIGNRELATFTEKYYVGTADFTIVPGEIANVTVTGNMVNIPVEVAYDATVDNYFDEFYTYVCAADSFVLEDAQNDEVPTLKYVDNRRGYFILPDNVSNICWYFYGKAGEKVITKSGVIENAESLKLYTLQFKYSPDAPGSIFFTATVDTNPEYKHDRVPFSPDPTVKGVGFNADVIANYTDGSRAYTVKALDKITMMTIANESNTFDLLDSSASYEGVVVDKVSDKEYTVTLSEPYFTTLFGGEQTIAFNIKDASGGIGYQECKYNIEGVKSISSYDLWWLTAHISATSFTSENVAVGYRANGGEWSYITATAAAESNIYNATITDFSAGKTYEYALFVGGAQVGKSRTITTAVGPQIPDAGFESWSTAGDSARCPAADPSRLFWDTGNHATADLTGKQLTVDSDDVRSGATGRYSAHLASIKASVFGIGKFAAGNLFIGRFVGVSGTDGIVEFGREFNFSARPKKVRFWVKNNQGTINEGSHTSGTDLAKVYCCFTDRNYTVDTSNQNTFFNPAFSTEGIIAKAVWETTESNTEWTLIELDIDYKEGVTSKPTHLVMTFTCSGYGDYYTGSTNSWMKVDDVEFVY